MSLSLKEKLLVAAGGVAGRIDDAIIGDGGARVELTPEQQAQMDRDLEVLQRYQKRQGIKEIIVELLNPPPQA